ncbi:hypothetical protein [Actinomadura rudentiformis]|uniref:hypothetical protein n=1 Tax=Actinomadura rudentiformis TaxID=359158 RepID=UPI00124F6510|nr:hypothetical protein [Actinomadura rudentiformis]
MSLTCGGQAPSDRQRFSARAGAVWIGLTDLGDGGLGSMVLGPVMVRTSVSQAYQFGVLGGQT